MQRLRISFKRGDKVKYISHLDIMRLWQRALVRAGVAVAYTEGFNPRPRLSIAAPLALGVTGEAELLDIFLADFISPHAFGTLMGSHLPAGITIRCPTEEDRAACEDGITLFGIPMESDVITHACDGRPGECTLSEGVCAEGLASEGLPASLRIYADFMWQRSPFDIGNPHAVDGQVQSPGRDLSEPYWMARHYGFITAGAGQVLAWRDTGACP